MMARIMNLPQQAHESAALQGRAMQWINFIRDIAEDNNNGRCYFPREDLDKFNLADLSKDTALNQPEDFKKFIRAQLERYESWQSQAQEGYHYIPKRLRIPLQTAADMYNWTSEVIAKDPMIVFERQVKPSKTRVVRRALRNTL
jgi:phytoene synthase